jgi:hypothetical protein
MRKKIRRIGNSEGIIFNAEERESYGLNVGKVADITINEVRPIPKKKVSVSKKGVDETCNDNKILVATKISKEQQK